MPYFVTDQSPFMGLNIPILEAVGQRTIGAQGLKVVIPSNTVESVAKKTRSSAIAERPRDAIVSTNLLTHDGGIYRA